MGGDGVSKKENLENMVSIINYIFEFRTLPTCIEVWNGFLLIKFEDNNIIRELEEFGIESKHLGSEWFSEFNRWLYDSLPIKYKMNYYLDDQGNYCEIRLRTIEK